MNILMSANKKYINPFLVSVYSLAQNTKETQIDLYFLNVSLNQKDIDFIKKKINNYHKIIFHQVDVKDDQLASLPLKAHFTLEAFVRLLLLKYLPLNMEKILWLDSDIVIHNNIDLLYAKDFEDSSLIACRSINQSDEENKKNLGIEDGQMYFNSGIILFNIVKMRTLLKDNDLMDYAVNNLNILKWLDQDVLNAVLGKSAKIIDYKEYNYMHFSGAEFDDLEINYINNNNCILHFIGPVKPWNFKFIGYTKKIWIKYAKAAKVYSAMFFIKDGVLSFAYLTRHRRL